MALEEVGAKLVLEGQSAFLSGMQKAAAVGTAFGMAIYNASIAAGKAFLDFSGDSIKAASNLNETFSKSQVVFGKYGTWIAKWGETSATSFGMSTNAALGAASTYGNLFRSMGLTEKASFDMSTGIVQLAADLASFNNLAPEDVLEKLRAGLTGESEPLKSLGVNINQATIEAKAMKMGLMKVGQELTAGAKAQAVYALITEQTSLAQGDFARTSDGLANQQRIFAANLENTKAKLGTALLPMVNLVMNAINKLFSNPKVMAGIEGFIKGIEKVATFLSGLFDDLTAEGGGLGVVFDDIKESLSGIVPPAVITILQTLWDFIDGIVDYMSFEGTPVISDFFAALANGFFAISGGVGIFQDLGELLFTVGDTVQSVTDWIAKTIQDFLTLVQGWWRDNGDSIMQSVSVMWENLKTVFGAGLNFIKTLVSFVMENIKLFWQTHGDKVIAIVNWLWTTVQTIFNAATTIISDIFNAFTALLQGDFEGFSANLQAAWGVLWGLIRSAAETAWASLSEWFIVVTHQILAFFLNTDWGAIGKAIITGIWDSLKNGWGWLMERVKELAATLLAAALSALDNKGKNYPGYKVPSGNPPDNTGPTKVLKSGLQEFANGGSFMIPMGFGNEGFNLGGIATASGGERVTITPKNVSAGPSIYNYNYSTNYNLQVMSNNSPAVVQQSFAMMKLLAG